MTQAIILIVVGVLIGALGPRILPSGILSQIVSIIGWIATVVGIVFLIMALI